MDLAAILVAAVEARSTLIDQTARRWPDRPIVVEMNWRPKLGTVDLVLRTIDHLPVFRPTPPLPNP